MMLSQIIQLSLVMALLHAAPLVVAHQEVQLPTTLLKTGRAFPMVGLEVDGLNTEEVGERILDAMQNTTQFGLYCTAQRNSNERRVNAGIVNAIKTSDLYSSEVHVVAKVPYTHLGYERTILSVKQSLQELNNRNTHVHIMLEWPRCDNSIQWMNCDRDEMRLPQAIKAAGPPPHHNEFSFVDSWKALEEIYLGEVSLGSNLPTVASIGVANFEIEDLQTLEMHGRIFPHVLQVSKA